MGWKSDGTYVLKEDGGLGRKYPSWSIQLPPPVPDQGEGKKRVITEQERVVRSAAELSQATGISLADAVRAIIQVRDAGVAGWEMLKTKEQSWWERIGPANQHQIII